MELVVLHWDLSLMSPGWGLVKTFVTGKGASRTIRFFSDCSAVKLISRFTGAVLEELVTAAANSLCTFRHMTNEKSFDVLDCERSHVNHRHGCFQPIVG